MSRFYPPGGAGNLTYGLYVVSGMLKNGSLIVSWSTGVPATQQIDYGIDDPTVPNQTTIPVDDQGQRMYSVFHEVAFPKTLVDTTHYFRARSQSRKGEQLESVIYSVYVPPKTVVGTLPIEVAPMSLQQVNLADKAVVECSSASMLINTDMPHLDLDILTALPSGNPSFSKNPYSFGGQLQTKFDIEITTTIT